MRHVWYPGRKEKLVLIPSVGTGVSDNISHTTPGGVWGTTWVPGSPDSREKFGGWRPQSSELFSLELILLSHSLGSDVRCQLVLIIWPKLSGFGREEAVES